MDNKNARVTVKDIAKAADVSIATVSRVLNQNYYVSPEITERVLEKAAELGYVPNLIARSLKINVTKTIGFIMSDISNTYHITIAKAVEDVIKQEDYSLMVCSTDNKKERELSYLNLLWSKNVDALILNCTGKNNELIGLMNQSIPMVCVNRKLDISGFHGDVVDTNNFKGAYLLTRQLLQLGHRKIFVVNGTPGLSNSVERFEGFCSAMAEAGLPVTSSYPYQYTGNFRLESGYQAIEYMCEMSDKPTAVLCMNNMMSIGALKCLKAKGINLPDDLSICSYDGIENMELMATRPSVACFNPYEIGTRVGNAILERITHPRQKNRQFIFEPAMIAGNTMSIPSDNFAKKFPAKNLSQDFEKTFT